MAVYLLDRNHETNYCEFSYDNWESDKELLPAINTAGKGDLSVIRSCSQGSFAIGTDGGLKTLNGDTNTWVDY